MALRLDQKKKIVASLKLKSQEALSVVLGDISGVKAEELTALRHLARKAEVHLQVTKNTLAKRALENTSFEAIHPHLSGSTLLGFSYAHPGAAARLLRQFSESVPSLTLKAGMFNGILFDTETIHRLVELPTKEEAIARLLATLKEPVAKLVRTFSEVGKLKGNLSTPDA